MSCSAEAVPAPDSAPSRGYLAVIEGPSGAGKTTVSAALVDLLRQAGCAVLQAAQPSDSVLGELARRGTFRYRGPSLSCLVAADRYDHLQREIEPALDSGVTVICDRYFPSALVLDRLDGLDVDFVWSLYRYMRMPDLVAFLVADPLTCLARSAARGRYSRLHTVDMPAVERETALYHETAIELERRGVSTVAVETTAMSPAAVAQLLIERIPSGPVEP